MLTRFEEKGLVGYRSALLKSIGVPHLFTTRRGGERDGELLRAAFAIARADPDGVELVSVRQVHGAHVHAPGPVVAAGSRAVGARPQAAVEADALVTSDPRHLLQILTADCVPVLLSRTDGSRVAAVHAGWRGLVAGVIPRAVEQLLPGEVVAAIGACLSVERFQVGPEVAEAFERADLAPAVRPVPGARPHVDLRAAATLQLQRAGVERIDVSDRCTWEHVEDFYSYRRDVTHGSQATTGRLAALIATASA